MLAFQVLGCDDDNGGSSVARREGVSIVRVWDAQRKVSRKRDEWSLRWACMHIRIRDASVAEIGSETGSGSHVCLRRVQCGAMNGLFCCLHNRFAEC